MEPTEISGYRVVRRLGAGGMGEVFLAQHPRLPRQDAVKLLGPQFGGDPSFAARFVREADVLAGLRHPNIVTVYDRGEFDGRLWLAMEYVDGHDAAQVLRERGPLPAEAVADVIDGVGSALDAAWQGRGLVHRDVKPANILLVFGDGKSPHRPSEIKLVDFGIAKAADEASALTATGAAMGTMTYLAPEVVESAPLDNRSDLYSLACTAFELLTGSPPYLGTGIRQLVVSHISAPIPDPADRLPGVPPALGPVFRRALAKEPAERYASGAEFTAAFRAALAGAPDRTQVTPTVRVPQTPAPTMPVPPMPVSPMPAPQVEHPAALVQRTAQYAPEPGPVGPYPAPAAAPRGRGRGLWIALAALFAAIVLAGGGYLWLTSGSGGERPAQVGSGASETETAPPTSASTTAAAPTVTGTDRSGFIGEYARCDGSEQLLAAMITEPAQGSGLPAHVVICSTGSGPVYRAMQVGDAVGISLAATRTANGYSAFNPNAGGGGGTSYSADLSTGVTVTSPGGSSEFLRWTQVWQR